MLALLRRPALALVLSLGVVSTSQAQDAPPAREISFDEALRLGLERNTTLRQVANAAEASDLAVSQARATFLPDLAASISPTQRYGLSFDQTTGRLEQESTQSLDASLSANLNLFNGFRDQASLDRARVQREAGEHSLERARQDVLFNVANQFLQVLLANELVGIQQENLEADRAQRDRIEQLVEAGARARADVLQQEALVAERVRDDYEVALLALKSLHRVDGTADELRRDVREGAV